MEAVQYLFNHFGEFLALVMRLSGIFVIAPVFSSDAIPRQVKGIIIMLLALISFPILISRGFLPSPSSFPELIFIGTGEFFVGFVIGFIGLMIITLFQVSGQFYSIQMGFGIINVFDPLSDASVPIISQLKTLLMSAVFIGLRGHHFLLRAVVESYRFVPAVDVITIQPVKQAMVTLFDRMFNYGFLIGLPLIGIVFLMTMSLGLLARLVPQMNVMVMGFGLKVLVGELTFVLLLPIFMHIAVDLFSDIFRHVDPVLRAMGGG